MWKRNTSSALLRLLRQGATKQTPEAEAASILERFYADQTIGGSSFLSSSCKGYQQSWQREYWQLGRRPYSKDASATSEPKVRHKKLSPIKKGETTPAEQKLKIRKTQEGGRVAASRTGLRSSKTAKIVKTQGPVSQSFAEPQSRQAKPQGGEAESQHVHKVPAPSRTYRRLQREVSLVSQLPGSVQDNAPRLDVVQSALEDFKEDSKVKDKSLALYVSSEAFPYFAEQFSDFIWSANKTVVRLEAALQTLTTEARMKYLFKLFAKYVVENHAEELTQYRDTINTLDLRQPFRWYPIARSLKRKFVYHAGPTNSGKTYTALQAMMQADSGVYCGPLRLLAMEVFDTCNAAGTFCNLVTGQERRIVPGAEHTSCTIEMLDTANRVDVAVVDEVQLIGDDVRGWAWTKALLALPANEIHLCGDGSAVDLVRKMAREMGEGFEMREYKRFTPVKIEPSSAKSDYSLVQQGDCVVAFSRKSIYEVKGLIEKHTGLRACLIYGALPPETRRQQAKLFNESDNDYDVLVASDAVGMGLNLNIRRIIFSTLVKHIGGKKLPISTSEIKQIAGRAGRRNSQYPVGYATCLNQAEMPILEKAMATPMSEMCTPTAGLFPEFEHFEAFAGKALISDFSELIERFGQEARLDGTYFFCRQESVLAIASMLQSLEQLSLKEKFTFCNAPVNVREPRQTACLLHFATRYANKLPVNLEVVATDKVPATADELQHMESLHQIVSLWLWLSMRFDETAFPNREDAARLSNRLIAQMDLGLQRLTAVSVANEAKPSSSRQSRLGILEIYQRMKRPYLRNLCPEAKDHQEKEQSTKLASLEKRLYAQSNKFKQAGEGSPKSTNSMRRAAVAA